MSSRVGVDGLLLLFDKLGDFFVVARNEKVVLPGEKLLCVKDRKRGRQRLKLWDDPIR
jgi:hypothetical protein